MISDNGLVIDQVNELRSQLSQKHPLFGLGDLSLAHTVRLETALSERATTQALNSAIITREPVIQDGGLTIARTSGLQAALDARPWTSDVNDAVASKASTQQLADWLATLR